jgi:hypothetical protein
MLTLAAMLVKIDGNTSYVDKYWDIMREWTDYLVENGQDPSNQLCTDDFAGHWAHNCNLSVKAIMGVAGFAEMARVKGDQASADKYMKKAKEMLEQTNDDISDIIEAVGFKNHEKFVFYFQQKTGMTPQEYRDKHQESQSNESAEYELIE